MQRFRRDLNEVEQVRCIQRLPGQREIAANQRLRPGHPRSRLRVTGTRAIIVGQSIPAVLTEITRFSPYRIRIAGELERERPACHIRGNRLASMLARSHSHVHAFDVGINDDVSRMVLRGAMLIGPLSSRRSRLLDWRFQGVSVLIQDHPAAL